MNVHPYISIGPKERQSMLDAIGVSSTDDLFSHIQTSFPSFDLAKGISEWELAQRAQEKSHANASTHDACHFMGAGVYDHWYPAVIDHLVMRGELLTAYTPYQPELSQGTLQIIYEFQSLMCRLYGMEVSNASVYDGAHALVECVLMAMRIQKVNHQPSVIVISEGIHPEYVSILKTFLTSYDNIKLIFAPLDSQTGEPQWGAVKVPKDHKVVAIAGQAPNFFGVLEAMDKLAKSAKAQDALSIVINNEPYAFALHEPPGQAGVDLVGAELQSFGTPISFGGPHVGVVLCRKKDIRQLPGRLVAKTRTMDGKQGAYTLTLSTREQHIRRERATSNICTNQGLLVNRVVAHCSLLGDVGLVEVAKQNGWGAKFALAEFSKIFEPLFPKGRIFNEFALKLTPGLAKRIPELAKEKIYFGVTRDMLKMPGIYPDKNFLLLCVTEKRRPEEIQSVLKRLGA